MKGRDITRLRTGARALAGRRSGGSGGIIVVGAGQPMTSGEKWVVTKWMRQRRFVPAGAE